METDEDVQADIDRMLDGRSIEDIERELDRQIAEKEAEENLQKQLTSTNNGVIIHNESEDFIFDDSKITGYMLCPGKEHYEEFVDVGYSKDDPQKLYDDIVSTFKKDELIYDGVNNGGNDRYYQKITLGVTKEKPFIAGYEMKNGNLRLVTCHRVKGDD